MINATQIRAARAVLGWSQDELVRASGLSIATIRKIELGVISPRASTMDAIEGTLQSTGIEFIEPDGVRRRPSDMLVFEGKSGGKSFLEDLSRTALLSGGEIFIVTPSAQAFANYCCLSNALDLDRLVDMHATIEIKCLVTHDLDVPFSTPRLQFRTMSRNHVDPVPFCTYGQKYALAVPNGQPFSKLIVVESAKMADAARNHFVSLWDKATPLRAQDETPSAFRRVV